MIGADDLLYGHHTWYLRLGLESTDLKLLTALVVAFFLSVPYWKGKYFTKGRKGEKRHA